MSKQDKGFQEKLRNFFRGNKQGISRSKSDEYNVLSEEVEAELRQNSPLPSRLKTIKELIEYVKQNGRLEAYTIEKLWILLKDLLVIRSDVTKEIRHLVIELFTCITKNQVEKNGAIRSKFFGFIQNHDILEDSGPRFEFLKALTENGRDVSYFDEKIGPFILTCMPRPNSTEIRQELSTKDFMSFLVNVIKFSQSFLDPEVLEGIVRDVCFLACTSEVKEDLMECLNVISAVICYPSLPPPSLSTLLATLCRLVNKEILCQVCWKAMRDLLGTHFGHSGILTMCGFMEIADQTDDSAVIRGAVFFVGAALWGSKSLRSLKYAASTVLSSFKQALERRHPCISYEIMMRIQDLIRTQGDTLNSIAWDLILDIVEKVVLYSKSKGVPVGTEDELIKVTKSVNGCLDLIQGTIDKGTFSGSLRRFYEAIDASVRFRPAYSVEKLLQYKASKFLHPTRKDWLTLLIAFADRHYKLETRSGLRVIALQYISSVCLANRDSNEEDLIEKVILIYLKHLETENESDIRKQGVKFISDFLIDSSSKKCHDLLHILEKIVNRPYETNSGDMQTVLIFSESDVIDVHLAVQGLIKIFTTKIYYLPSSIPIMAYKIICKHLTIHYKKPSILEECTSIRHMIFDCFFKIRANSLFHLGFPKAKEQLSSMNYSSYLAVDYREGDELSTGGNETPAPSSPPQSAASVTSGGTTTAGSSGGSSPQPSTPQIQFPQPVVTYISLQSACKLVVTALRKEKDWPVLELILKQLPHVMENKALILSKHGNDINYLASAVCAMMTDKSMEYPDTLRRRPLKFQKSDFYNDLYPILTSLVSYHSHLETSQQGTIVKLLERGLVTPRSTQICIVSLSTCTLEMKDTMHKLLPEVLLALSKITPKVNIAIPVLEFLSTLIHLPRVFASFVQDQYMSIFAIALPYTNPFKFSQYTVSLAHHVIAMWFLKCRLSFRRGFVSYIIKGLQNNVINPCEEEKRRSAMELMNEDSSNRKRSSSLTEQSSKRRDRPISGHTIGGGTGQSLRPQISADAKPQVREALLAFHQELTETCIDLMARYAFSDSSALPTRFPSSNFLLVGGLSQTWLMDNRIITITTSGCTQKELRDNLCERCWLLCQKPSPVLSNPEIGGVGSGRKDSCDLSKMTIDQLNSSDSSGGSRRRHRSELTSSTTKFESDTSTEGKTKDDTHLELEHKLQPFSSVTRRLSLAGDLNDGDIGDWLQAKNEHMFCACWCQGWAEIHIRRPTGNTSWMMRIQNQIGNNVPNDLPIRELSALFLRDPKLLKSTNSESTLVSSSFTPPHHESTSSVFESPLTNLMDGSLPINYLNEDTSVISSHEHSPTQQKSSSSPSSPKHNSPSEEKKGIKFPNDPKKLTVHRSNSSPEMETWKSTYVNQQYQIKEQDEENCSPPKHSDLEKYVVGTGKGHGATQSNSATSVTGRTSNFNNHKGGTTSPYRGSYEAIPEEVLQKDATVASSPSTISTAPPQRSLSVSTALPIDKTQVASSLKPQHSIDESSLARSSKDFAELLEPVKRDRTNTVSVMSGPHARTNKGVRRIYSAGSSDIIASKFSGRSGGLSEYRIGSSEGSTGSNLRSGMSPGFVFLQLCHQGFFGKDIKPLLVPPKLESSLKVFDYIPPYETHKIGVVYIGCGQSKNEGAILQNTYGSIRYRNFLQGLGKLLKLQEVDPQKTFLGGLSKNGEDGEYAYVWQDDVMQVVFHVATLMPTKATDPNCDSKKRHIGNDYVAIIYNNSNENFDIMTLKGQFLYACIEIEPLDHGTNRIVVKTKPGMLDQIGLTEPKIVSDMNLPTMARQLALHSNLASVIVQNKRVDPYASNWLERLRHIKKLRSRIESPNSGEGASGSSPNESGTPSPPKNKQTFNVVDFTEFV